MSERSFWYLACPYTTTEDAPLIRSKKARYNLATKAAGWLMDRGRLVFSPITHGHNIKTRASWDDWMDLDLAVLESPRCEGVIVLKAPGWEDSRGVRREIAAAKALGKPVLYLDCKDWMEALCFSYPWQTWTETSKPKEAA